MQHVNNNGTAHCLSTSHYFVFGLFVSAPILPSYIACFPPPAAAGSALLCKQADSGTIKSDRARALFTYTHNLALPICVVHSDRHTDKWTDRDGDARGTLVIPDTDSEVCHALLPATATEMWMTT